MTVRFPTVTQLPDADHLHGGPDFPQVQITNDTGGVITIDASNGIQLYGTSEGGALASLPYVAQLRRALATVQPGASVTEVGVMTGYTCGGDRLAAGVYRISPAAMVTFADGSSSRIVGPAQIVQVG